GQGLVRRSPRRTPKGSRGPRGVLGRCVWCAVSGCQTLFDGQRREVTFRDIWTRSPEDGSFLEMQEQWALVAEFDATARSRGVLAGQDASL
ncbi:MAG: hypothetical protein ACODAD_03250, partial [Planctomycetota bacterium]